MESYFISRQMKILTSRIALMALGVTFELASKYVKEMKEEIADWEDGLRVSIGILPSGPAMTIIKQSNGVRYLGMGKKEPHLQILFKNLESAFMLFTGQMGAARAVAENRVIVYGNNSQAMQLTRGMAIVQTYLFPGFILNKIFKRPPQLTWEQLLIKAKIMGLLTPNLILSLFR